MQVPQNVRQENQERDQTADPDPFVKECPAMLGQQQADDDSQPEDCNRVLLLQPESRDDAESDPVARVVSLNGKNNELSAAQPEIGLKDVGAEQSAVGEILRRQSDADGGEDERI